MKEKNDIKDMIICYFSVITLKCGFFFDFFSFVSGSGWTISGSYRARVDKTFDGVPAGLSLKRILRFGLGITRPTNFYWFRV